LRGEFGLRFKWEIVEDLFWDLSFYESFDSDPVVEGTTNNDRGVTTSVGWQL
jgi:hypothetical protein